MCSDLVWFPWFLKSNPRPPSQVFLVLQFAGISSRTRSKTHNDTLLLFCRFVGLKDGEQRRPRLLTVMRSPAPLLLEQWKGSAQWEPVSQEAIWALLRSPVSRLLNPVSTSTKQEEAQPPTADISDSLYNAMRWRMNLCMMTILLFHTAHCHFAQPNFMKQKLHCRSNPSTAPVTNRTFPPLLSLSIKIKYI